MHFQSFFGGVGRINLSNNSLIEKQVIITFVELVGHIFFSKKVCVCVCLPERLSGSALLWWW